MATNKTNPLNESTIARRAALSSILLLLLVLLILLLIAAATERTDILKFAMTAGWLAF
jgi:succinate-acetate transporter protein